MDELILEARSVSMHFGGLRAVDNVSFTMRKGEILGLIGPNGAGKTTLFNVISGVYRPTSGAIIFDGKDTTGFPPYRMAELGLGRTFQIVRPFPDLTVLENVMIPLHLARFGRLLASFSSWNTSETRTRALQLLEETGISNLADKRAGLLPLGNQRKLELARALALRPKLLLLDETFSGLRHEEIDTIAALVRSVRKKGISILLIEHNMKVAMGLSDRVVVLDHGRLLTEGEPEAVRRNPAVIEAYLGKGSMSYAS